MASRIASSIQTPSGLVFPNRLTKAAMAEGMADDSDPGDRYIAAYTNWSSGGWGAILTGNVDISIVHRGDNNSIAVKPDISQKSRDAWTRWALASQRDGTPAIVQVVHTGRQSPGGTGTRGFTEKSIAPSPIPINIGNGILERILAKVVFGTPREMTEADIEEVVQQFANAAKLAHESGFKGVELHGAHGYLLSAFLSPKSNVRTDAYGGTAAKRARIVLEVIRAVRKVVPDSFCVGIKLNSADVAGAENLEESLEQVGLIAAEQIDFLEISGGSFENMRMANGDDDPKAQRTAQREAFFLDYARAVRARYPKVILMVTGGFRSRIGMEAALESGACDLIGLARPAAAFPHLPKDILLNNEIKDADAAVQLDRVLLPWWLSWIPIKIVGTGADSLYYVNQIQNMSVGKKPVPPPKA